MTYLFPGAVLIFALVATTLAKLEMRRTRRSANNLSTFTEVTGTGTSTIIVI